MNALVFLFQQFRVRARSLATWILVWCIVGALFASVFNSLSKNPLNQNNFIKVYLKAY